jgi:methylphosphotriester-DNA--protein-cysteine methyltransferase
MPSGLRLVYARRVWLAARDVEHTATAGFAALRKSDRNERAMHDEMTPNWLGDACAYIEANATNGVTVTDVASAVNVTPAELTDEFRRHLGFTPEELRRELLAHSSLSV